MTVFFDIDTQRDFLEPSGALYVPGAEWIVDCLATLNRFAALRGIPVVSTMDAHAPDDPEFANWPAHCVAGTRGQQKPPSTLLENRVTVPNSPVLPSIAGAQQIVVEKQALDCFTNVNFSTLVDSLGAERCVVYGVVTEICVKYAAMGLLKTGRRVEIVTDAIKELDAHAASKSLAEFTAAGGTLVTSVQVTAAR